ncbi:HAD family hydrolase [Candidatus Woesearchaeota archaeon]|nr:HAD family hydrolase [Candidatus Woesearchaeota archaeon]
MSDNILSINDIDVFVEDYDDTIVYNSCKYELAKGKACIAVLEFLGHRAPYVDELLPKLEKIEAKIVTRAGFSKASQEEIFTTFLETQCAEAGVAVPNELRTYFLELAHYPITPSSYTRDDIIAGAEETLMFKIAQGKEMYIVTRGDELIQKAKMQYLGIDKYFKPENIRVTSTNDKRALLEEISTGKDRSRIAVVDNGLAMINAATELGFLGFFIPLSRGCRDAEKDSRGVINKERTVPLESILEIKTNADNYKNWNQRILANDLKQYILDHDKH